MHILYTGTTTCISLDFEELAFIQCDVSALMRHYAMVKVEAVEPFNLHPHVPYTFIRCLRPFFFGGWALLLPQ